MKDARDQHAVVTLYAINGAQEDQQMLQPLRRGPRSEHLRHRGIALCLEGERVEQTHGNRQPIQW